MLDGSFDQHFLEIFATAQDRPEPAEPQGALAFSLLAVAVFALCLAGFA